MGQVRPFQAEGTACAKSQEDQSAQLAGMAPSQGQRGDSRGSPKVCVVSGFFSKCCREHQGESKAGAGYAGLFPSWKGG